MSPGVHGPISIRCLRNVSGKEEGTTVRNQERGGKKERQGERLKAHGFFYGLCECHVLWASVVYLVGDHLVLLLLRVLFVIHIFISPATFGRFFQFKSKGCISWCDREPVSDHDEKQSH